MTGKVLVLAGPTASGKTRLGIELARRLGGEIISADSMQFYRGMEIGTAAPTPEELALARHHFVSFLAPDQSMAAGEYQRQARVVIREIQARGGVPVVVGGSGLYIRALVDGLFEGPPRDQSVRDRLRREAVEAGNSALFARLRAVDPGYAETLTSENDLVRVVRALEVHEITGVPFSHWHEGHQFQTDPLEAVWLGLLVEREALYERIGRRVDAMMAAGWLGEVRRLLDGGYGPHLDRLKALGFRELTAHLRGEQSLEAAVEAAKFHHRRYAKRQMTWFRAEKRLYWLDAGDGTVPAEILADRAEEWWRGGGLFPILK